MNSETLKTHDWIALYVLTALLVFGIVAYFVKPADAESAKDIVHALIDALGMILSFKFGVHVATPSTPQNPPAPNP